MREDITEFMGSYEARAATVADLAPALQLQEGEADSGLGRGFLTGMILALVQEVGDLERRIAQLEARGRV